MSAKKLTEADKVEILKLYRNPEETTSTLARRYDVSHSTISRLLKSNLSPDDYEGLIQQKRSMRPHGQVSEPTVQTLTIGDDLPPTTEIEAEEDTDTSLSSSRRLRKRSSAISNPNEPAMATQLSLPLLDVTPESVPESDELLDETYRAEASTLREMLGEDLLDTDEDLADLDEDEDDLDEDDEDDDLDEEIILPRRRFPSDALVQVLPIEEASFPRPCYLVVDRAAELITRPLRDFGDLGQIPKEEVQQKTLPIFDNHRVARRFSNRAQRVIKVPDGRMLQKVGPYLKAKGITRLLIDGQVYSVSNN